MQGGQSRPTQKQDKPNNAVSAFVETAFLFVRVPGIPPDER